MESLKSFDLGLFCWSFSPAVRRRWPPFASALQDTFKGGSMEAVQILQISNSRLEQQLDMLHDTIARLKSVLARPSLLSMEAFDK